jgi:hypothetical protein
MVQVKAPIVWRRMSHPVIRPRIDVWRVRVSRLIPEILVAARRSTTIFHMSRRLASAFGSA